MRSQLGTVLRRQKEYRKSIEKELAADTILGKDGAKCLYVDDNHFRAVQRGPNWITFYDGKHEEGTIEHSYEDTSAVSFSVYDWERLVRWMEGRNANV